MFAIRTFCNDTDNKHWDEPVGTYKTYEQALVACFQNALAEARELMSTSNPDAWFEVEVDFEITEGYEDDLLKGIAFFPVAVAFYDHAPWDRENDCYIKIVTGYAIEKVSESKRESASYKPAKSVTPRGVSGSKGAKGLLDLYNERLRSRHGPDITVEIKKVPRTKNFYYTTRKYGDSDHFSSIEEAYARADEYLCGVGELW